MVKALGSHPWTLTIQLVPCYLCSGSSLFERHVNAIRQTLVLCQHVDEWLCKTIDAYNGMVYGRDFLYSSSSEDGGLLRHGLMSQGTLGCYGSPCVTFSYVSWQPALPPQPGLFTCERLTQRRGVEANA